MALRLSTALDTGVTAEYYRVTELNLRRESDTAEVWVTLYVDAAARGSGKTGVREYKFNLAGFTLSAMHSHDDAVALAYDLLKGQDFFSGAADA